MVMAILFVCLSVLVLIDCLTRVNRKTEKRQRREREMEKKKKKKSLIDLVGGIQFTATGWTGRRLLSEVALCPCILDAK